MVFCHYNVKCETSKSLGKVSMQCTVLSSLIYCFFASFHHSQEIVLSGISFPKATLEFLKDCFKVARNLLMDILVKMFEMRGNREATTGAVL